MLTKRPAPPNWMSTTGYPAFYRISGHLWARGLWLDQYSDPAAHAAMACTYYVRKVLEATPPEEIEEFRDAALESLDEIGWSPPRPFRLSLVSADGYDVELIELCRPLGD